MKLPEVIISEEEFDLHVQRLKDWIGANFCCECEQVLRKVDAHLRWYERTEFKGRYKTHITRFHERAKVILTKSIYDKSQSRRASC